MELRAPLNSALLALKMKIANLKAIPGLGRLAKSLLLWFLAAAALYLLDPLIPGFKVASFPASLAIVAIISLLNALVWPYLVALLVRLPLLIFAGLAVLLNGALICLAAIILQSVEVTNLMSGLLVSVLLTGITSAFSNLFSLEDDSYYYYLLKRRNRRQAAGPSSSGPAALAFIEIDGCSAPVLRLALKQGYLPTLAGWLAQGSHKLAEWDCGLSSQTCASQAGIMYGCHQDIPAYRWYERKERHIFSAAHPGDVARLEERLSDGQGLLANGGACRGTLFSGDAAESLFTASTLFRPGGNRSQDYYAFFADPYIFSRTFLLCLREVWLELWSRRWRPGRSQAPRSPRGGYYPLVRAFSTVVLRELSVYTLMADLLRGVEVSYTAFLGYDEVAHHSGLLDPEALAILKNLDRQLARLNRAARQSPRPVRFVLLSDHGQSQGATFKQRTGQALPALVDSLLAAEQTVLPHIHSGEGWRYLNTFLKEAADRDTRPARLLRYVTRSRRTEHGEVLYGPERANPRRLEPEAAPEAVVLASGNLGLIYFTGSPARLSLEEINELYPNLLPGLLQQPEIGFALVRSHRAGLMALGAGGINFLESGRVQGENPLKNFGPGAAGQLREVGNYSNAPDILLNSFYDPEREEVAAFEELCSCHGGLGGWQNRPFLLYPAEFRLPPEPLEGPDALYRLFKGWRAGNSRAATNRGTEPSPTATNQGTEPSPTATNQGTEPSPTATNRGTEPSPTATVAR